MYYELKLESNVGTVRFLWGGGRYADFYIGGDIEPRGRAKVWNDNQNRLKVNHHPQDLTSFLIQWSEKKFEGIEFGRVAFLASGFFDEYELDDLNARVEPLSEYPKGWSELP